MFCGKKTKKKQNIKTKADEQQRNKKGWRKISKEVPLKERKKRLIKDERNEETALIGINGGQENKKQKKTYLKKAPRFKEETKEK